MNNEQVELIFIGKWPTMASFYHLYGKRVVYIGKFMTARKRFNHLWRPFILTDMVSSNTCVKCYFTNRISARGRHVVVHLLHETGWQYFYEILSQLQNYFLRKFTFNAIFRILRKFYATKIWSYMVISI